MPETASGDSMANRFGGLVTWAVGGGAPVSREAQRMLVSIVKVRFPALAELAEQEAAKITNAGALELLVQKVVAAPDENFARWLLSSPVA